MLALAPAFADPVTSSQSVFHATMNALARPGSIHRIDAGFTPPAPLSAVAAAVALTLLDHETPVWLDPSLAAQPQVVQWLRFHTGAGITEEPQEAVVALIADAAHMPPLRAFATGSMEYPDRSTTLVIQVRDFESGDSLTLSGPGISGARMFSPASLPTDMAKQLAENHALFPRGVDLVLTATNAVAGLPRSTRVTRGK